MEVMGELGERKWHMFENKTETQARAEILNAVKEYCNTFHNEKKKFESFKKKLKEKFWHFQGNSLY